MKDEVVEKKGRTFTGTVTSSKMEKTIVVSIKTMNKHPRYKKYIRKTQKLYVHDEKCIAKDGNVVKVRECRPISKTKCWELIEVVS